VYRIKNLGFSVRFQSSNFPSGIFGPYPYARSREYFGSFTMTRPPTSLFQTAQRLHFSKIPAHRHHPVNNRRQNLFPVTQLRRNIHPRWLMPWISLFLHHTRLHLPDGPKLGGHDGPLPPTPTCIMFVMSPMLIFLPEIAFCGRSVGTPPQPTQAKGSMTALFLYGQWRTAGSGVTGTSAADALVTDIKFVVKTHPGSLLCPVRKSVLKHRATG
jgi:hypothetical protein